MISFLEYLAEAKRGRKPTSQTHDADIKFLQKHNIDTSVNSTQKIHSLRSQFLKSITAAGHDIKDLESKSLKDLADYIKKNKIQIVKHIRQTDDNYSDDVKFIRHQHPDTDSKAIRRDILSTKSKYIKAIVAAGKKLTDIEKKSLSELDAYVKANDINLSPKHKRVLNWKQHEKNVTEGIQNLFSNGFFKFKSNKKLDPDKYKVEVINHVSGLVSDVQVKGPNLDFFIECKLDFETSNYFKYGLKIHGDKITYDHKRYLGEKGEDGKVDPEQAKKVDSLFKKIDISGFLNDIVSDKNVVSTWKKFLSNIREVESFIKSNDEFKQFAENTKFTSDYPDNFSSIVSIFDTYCNYYIDKYNKLIDKIFTLFDSKTLNIGWFKIKHHGDKDKGTFKQIAILQGTISDDKLEVYDQKAFEQTVAAILKIETKFNALLSSLGKSESNILELLDLENSDKAMYFFKMFYSSVGRRKKGSDYNQLLAIDKLGNMEICSQVKVKNSRLAKMITDFYTKKDNCKYIQISDVIFIFDKKDNPLAIKNLPTFEEIVTDYTIKILVNDALTAIKLQVFADPIDKKALSGFNIVSFKKNDSNYVGKGYSITINV